MGVSQASARGLKLYLKYVNSLEISNLSFQDLETLLLNKAVSRSETAHINKCELFSLCDRYFMIDSDKNPLKEIQKNYFIGLFNECVENQNDSTITIYLFLLYLLPLLKNSVDEKAKAFNICLSKMANYILKGEQFVGIVQNYITWNTQKALSSIIPVVKCKENIEDLQALNEIMTEQNISRFTISTLLIIAANEKDLNSRNIVYDDLSLVALKNPYLYDIDGLLKEIHRRFTLDTH